MLSESTSARRVQARSSRDVLAQESCRAPRRTMEEMQDQFADLDVLTRRGKAWNTREEVHNKPRALDEDDNVIAVPAEPMAARRSSRSSASSLEDKKCMEETSGRMRTNSSHGFDPDMQRTVQAVVDTSVKYYTDKILQVLEGYNQKIQTIEKVVERVQSDVNAIKSMMEEQGEAYEGRFNSIDTATKENLRLTQLLRDRQEIREAQEELKKLSKKAPTAPSSTKASEAGDDSEEDEEEEEEIPSPKKEKTKGKNRHLQRAEGTAGSEKVDQNQYCHQPAAPPYYNPQGAPPVPQQQYHAPPPPPPPNMQHGMQAPQRLSYSNEGRGNSQGQASQQSLYGAQMQPPPVPKGVASAGMGSPNYSAGPGSQMQYPQVSTQQGYSMGQQYAQPRSVAGQTVEGADPYGAPPQAAPRSASYPRVYGNPPGNTNNSMASSSPAQVTTSKMPIDRVIDDVANMGFSRDQVFAVVRTLHANGQNIDLNVVLDKLMSEGATRAPGWN